MVIFSFGKDLYDTILQEVKLCSIITWLLKNLIFLILLCLQIVYDIMQSIVSDILEVVDLLNVFTDESLHAVIICINTLFQLIEQVRELNQDLFVG